MGKMSREKGARFERKIAKELKEWGYDAHRTAQYRGNTGDAGDVEGLPYVHLECKNQQRMSLYDWYAQSEHDARAAGKNEIPVVIHKANNKPILVTMSFPHWLEMYREYEAGRSILEKEAENDGKDKENADTV